MPKVTQQYRDARRDQILAAAARCFLRDGFHATSMQDLFAEAGLSAGAVYRYFTGKDEVITAIAEENMRDVLTMIHNVATRRPGQSLGTVLADVLQLLRAKDAQDGLGRMAILVWAEALRNPSLADQLRDLLNRMHTDLTELVEEHQGAGNLPRDVAAGAIARALISMMSGYILQLTILGPGAVDGVPGAVRSLWPEPIAIREPADPDG